MNLSYNFLSQNAATRSLNTLTVKPYKHPAAQFCLNSIQNTELTKSLYFNWQR